MSLIVVVFTFFIINSFPLYLASLFGYDDIISLLLTHPDIDINQQSFDGYSPLFMAISEEYFDTVDYLLSNPKIDMTLPNHDGISFILTFIYLHFS